MVFERFIVLRADSFQNQSGFTIHSVIVFFSFFSSLCFYCYLRNSFFFGEGKQLKDHVYLYIPMIFVCIL